MQSSQDSAVAVEAPAASQALRKLVGQVLPRKIRRIQGPGCTHMTVTRLYTSTFRCLVCLRVSPMGWLYRCTQDRELLLYEDMEHDNLEKLDELCDIFELPTSPPKRSPVARLDKLSFLDEITEEQRHTYSQEQLARILEERAHVLETASAPVSRNKYSSKSFYKTASSDSEADQTTSQVPNRPWFPFKDGGECQFKCCHFCRQNYRDRSYLSLNGVADGDIPLTAAMGFGFNKEEGRPIALVQHVRNLGLRPNPPPRMMLSSGVARPLPPTPNESFIPFPGLNLQNINLGLGLGIYTTTPFNSLPNLRTNYSSDNIPRSRTMILNSGSTESIISNVLTVDTGLASLVDKSSIDITDTESLTVPLLPQTAEQSHSLGDSNNVVALGMANTENQALVEVLAEVDVKENNKLDQLVVHNDDMDITAIITQY